MADKCIKTFTTWKIDLIEYKDESLTYIADIEKEYITSASYHKLTETEQITLVARFLKDNFFEPLKHLFNARNLVVKNPEGLQCAESLLCHLNSHYKNEGRIKSGATKMMSLVAAWMWSATEPEQPETRIKYYTAVWNAFKPETKCDQQYTPTGKENICHIFPWQSNFMSLNFEHTEL